MDFDRKWTQFALDAEIDFYGTGRICLAHNASSKIAEERERALMEEVQGLKEQHEAMIKVGARHVEVINEMIEREQKLVDALKDTSSALKNLHALVRGECPSLLEDDHHDMMAIEAMECAEDALAAYGEKEDA